MKYSGKPIASNTLFSGKKSIAEFKTLAKMNKKEDWEKFASSLNRNTPINQAWNRVRQLKGKDPKKANTFEVYGAQYKTAKAELIK